MRKIDWWLIPGFIGFAFLIWITANLWYEVLKIRPLEKRIEAIELAESRLESKMFQLPDFYKKVELFQYKLNRVQAEQERIKRDMRTLEELIRPIEKEVFPEKYEQGG